MDATTARQRHTEYMRLWRPAHREQVNEADRRYDSSEVGRECRRRAQRAWKSRNRELVRERNRIGERVRLAVRAGRLIKTACPCGSAEVQAHHHNGYEPEHELDVIWLCIPCHRKAHDR
jgi:hypothetical protein